MHKLRVLIISNNYYPYFDGISVYTNNLYEQLMQQGHAVKLLNFDKAFSKKNFHPRDFMYTSATRNSYYSIWSILNPFLLTDNNKGLRNFVFTNMVKRVSHKIINEFQPDIIHVTYTRIFSSVQDTHIPVVLTAHAEEITGNYPVNTILNKARSIICISKYTSDLVKKVNPYVSDKITVIPNSIDIKKYQIARDETIHKKNQILSIARLSPEKNIDNIIKAFSLLPIEIQNTYNLLIIGGGGEKEALDALIGNLHLNGKVHLLGNVTDERKIMLLKESKYFLLCPRSKKGEQEGFGIVFLEARAAGLPIITSKIGGIRDAVGDAGIYVNGPNDPKDIADTLKKLIVNFKLGEELIQKGSKNIFWYDHKKWINKIERVYFKLTRL